MVTIAEGPTRADLALCMTHLATEAARCSSRDNLGRENPRWRDLHANLDLMLCEWERAE